MHHEPLANFAPRDVLLSPVDDDARRSAGKPQKAPVELGEPVDRRSLEEERVDGKG
jgi:hypothetical protein